MTPRSKHDAAALPGSANRARGHVSIRLEHRPLWSIARALIGQQPGVAFLDSGGGSSQARWSFLGWNPRRVIAWPQGRAGAFECLRACFEETGAATRERGFLPFHAGWMGWFSYDLGRHVERLPVRALADATLPDFVLGDYDMVLVEDHVDGALWAAGRCNDVEDEERIRARAHAALRLAERHTVGEPALEPPDGAAPSFAGTVPSAADILPATPGAGEQPATRSLRALMERETYRRRVESILEYIRDGSIYQANFSHRFAARSSSPSRRLYELLRRESPAPYACYLGLPGGPEILSASPELFLRKTGDHVYTRPIKGTRPRHADPVIDQSLRDELEASEKERAELLMITDLLRNDLGRVAAYGSVKVDTLRALESHATVHHTHSEISARLRAGVGISEVLAATIPGGSVTGAPKIRAMEILDELEPVRRGPYTGAAGFIGDDGDMCLNILIRTLVRRGEDIWYQVGGGIVADSDADAEYEETLAKGAALQRAVTRAG